MFSLIFFLPVKLFFQLLTCSQLFSYLWRYSFSVPSHFLAASKVDRSVLFVSFAAVEVLSGCFSSSFCFSFCSVSDSTTLSVPLTCWPGRGSPWQQSVCSHHGSLSAVSPSGDTSCSNAQRRKHWAELISTVQSFTIEVNVPHSFSRVTFLLLTSDSDVPDCLTELYYYIYSDLWLTASIHA